MNSDAKWAMAHLSRIAAALGEARLAACIDRPLDAAVASYQTTRAGMLTGESFNNELAAFVRHVCVKSSFLGGAPSRAEALALAVDLLDHGYGGHRSGGYEHALLDVTEGDTELDAILTWIAESMKSGRRQAHRRWIFARDVEGLRWTAKRELVALILDLDGDYGNNGLPPGDPDRLVNHLVPLIEAHLAADSVFHNAKPRPLAASWLD